jgi:hypothetical protein
MDHILGEIASQLPMFIDPTRSSTTCWPATGTPPTPWATAPTSVTPRAYGNANAMALLMAAFTEGDRRKRRPRLLGHSGLRRRHRRPAPRRRPHYRLWLAGDLPDQRPHRHRHDRRGCAPPRRQPQSDTATSRRPRRRASHRRAGCGDPHPSRAVAGPPGSVTRPSVSGGVLLDAGAARPMRRPTGLARVCPSAGLGTTRLKGARFATRFLARPKSATDNQSAGGGYGGEAEVGESRVASRRGVASGEESIDVTWCKGPCRGSTRVTARPGRRRSHAGARHADLAPRTSDPVVLRRLT